MPRRKGPSIGQAWGSTGGIAPAADLIRSLEFIAMMYDHPNIFSPPPTLCCFPTQLGHSKPRLLTRKR